MTEEELDALYGKGLNAAGEPRARQALEIHTSRLGVSSEIETDEDQEKGVGDGEISA